MRQTIHGIYLGHINYSDSSVIARLYTQEYGKQSFVLKGVRSKKSKKIGLLQPLNFLEISCNYNPSKQLNTIYTLNALSVQNGIALDIRKSTIAMFMAEILNKCIQESEANPMLFGFIKSQINELDNNDFKSYLHIMFMVELSLLLGIYPKKAQIKSETLFNLGEGLFEHENRISSLHLNAIISAHLNGILNHGALYFENAPVSKLDRSDLLDALVRYFEIQLSLKKGAIQSHEVLTAVFS